jgi:type I restriction enzyme, S subunit
LNGAHGDPYVKVEDMNNCSKYQSVSREYAEKSSRSLPKGAVLFPKRGAAIMGNKVRIAAVSFYIDSNMMALFPRKGSRLLPEFLYYLIITQQLSRIADTSSIPQINNKHIIAHDVVIPSPPEQEKIADCLSFLDEIINAQTQKLDFLYAHKRGLMQQLFPALDEVQG